jgi:hypothetical protein
MSLINITPGNFAGENFDPRAFQQGESSRFMPAHAEIQWHTATESRLDEKQDQVAADATRVRHLAQKYGVHVVDVRKDFPADGLYVWVAVGDLVLFLTRERPYELEPWRTNCTHGWFETFEQIDARLAAVGPPSSEIVATYQGVGNA